MNKQKKSADIDLSQSLKPVLAGVRRFQFTLIFVIIVGGLAYAILTLNSIIAKSSDPNGYTSKLTVSNFNQATINSVNKLHTSNETTTITLPGGRINPFTE